LPSPFEGLVREYLWKMIASLERRARMMKLVALGQELVADGKRRILDCGKCRWKGVQLFA
jgi:hypothetical protein